MTRQKRPYLHEVRRACLIHLIKCLLIRCYSLLGTGWSPVLNVEALCLSIQSMLASCTKKSRPPGNDKYVRNAPISPKHTQWVYDDDR